MEVIFRSLPGKEAGLLAAMILGERGAIDWGLNEKLKNSGLVHLVVVSGSNVMLLGGFVIEFLAGWIGRKKAIIIGLMVLWWYTGLVGWEAPVVRATLLLSIGYWAQLWGRKFDWMRGLGLAIVLMVWGNLGVLKEASFWLSVVAYIAITNKPITNNQINTKIYFSGLTTIWVTAWVTPILAMIGGKISLVAPISNWLVMGAVAVATGLGVVGAGLGLGWEMGGRMVLWLAWPMVRWLEWVGEGMGGWKWAAVGVRFNWMMLVGWELIMGWFWIKHRDVSTMGRTPTTAGRHRSART